MSTDRRLVVDRARFPQALATLTGTPAPAESRPGAAPDGRALVASAEAAGHETVPVEWAGRPTATFVAQLAPGWCVVADGVVVVRRAVAGWTQLVTPSGTRWVRSAQVAALIEATGTATSPILDYPELRDRRRAATALARGRALPAGVAVRVRPGPSVSVGRHLRAEQTLLPAVVTVLGVVVGYVLLGVQWAWAGDHLLDSGANPGGVDLGWLGPWVALAAAGVAVRALAQLALGVLTVRATAWAKRRVVARAVGLDPDAVHEAGPSRVLGRTFDVDAAESGLAGGCAAAGLGLAQLLLGAGALLLVDDGPVLLAALAGFTAATCALGLRFLRRKRAWTHARHAASTRLTEELLEHPARLVQGRPAGDADAAREELGAIARASRRCDRLGAWLVGATAPSWLLVSLLVLAVVWRAGGPGPATAAATVGLVLLLASGFEALTVAVDDLTDGAVAVAGARTLLAPERSDDPVTGSSPVVGRPGVEVAATAVTVTYPGRGTPSLSDFTEDIRSGEKVLLSGPSGSGKSTAVAVLAGVLDPTAGDVRRTGSAVAVPQHHRNHLFSGTLLFNLLLGRGWPPTLADVEEAERVCRALELGTLLETMPGGLDQHVGETGWQLSDGERVRVYAARALLQDPALVLLDETLSALDPLTAAACRDSIAAHARAVVLTHHP